MKLLIATPYFGTHVGGLEHYVQHTAEALAARGWEVHVVTSGAPKTTGLTGSTTEQVGGLTIHRLRTSFVLSNTPVGLGWMLAARRLIRELAPDVINVHAPVPSVALAVTAAAGSTPVVVTYHAGSMKKGQPVIDAVIGVYERVLLPWMLGRANRIICASNFVRDQFLGKWQDKSVTITPGVDMSVFTTSKLPRTSGQVLFAGDFRDPRKGLSTLLEAIKHIPEATLVVAGMGEPVNQDRVDFVGRVDQAALAQLMQTSRLLVLPSTTDAESFGMVLIEAMACGLPVVGSRIGGIPTVISHGHNGLLIPAGDAKALAEAIHQILADEKLAARLGTAGQRDAAQYNWSTRADATHNLLMEVTRG